MILQEQLQLISLQSVYLLLFDGPLLSSFATAGTRASKLTDSLNYVSLSFLLRITDSTEHCFFKFEDRNEIGPNRLCHSSVESGGLNQG